MKETIRAIEEVTGVREEDWLSNSRNQEVVYARYLIAYELQQRHDYSYKMLADYFGKSYRFARYLIIKARNNAFYNKDFQRIRRQFLSKMKQ